MPTRTSDEDLDVLQAEAEWASTPTRRAWAQRLLERLKSKEDLLTNAPTYPTTTNPDEPAVHSIADHVGSAAGARDSS